MSVSGKMLQRLRNYPIWRTKILNGGFLFSEKLLKEGEGGVGENKLPSKVVVGANNIYHVGNVTVMPLCFSAWSLLFFRRDQIFLILRKRAFF